MTHTPPPADSVPTVTHEDGRVSLPAGDSLPENQYVNSDIHPLPMRLRQWSGYSFTALWVSMAVNIPSWLLASGLVTLGMDWRQAVMTIALANLIVLVPMVLTGHAGAKYGIPYPVFARASFGVRGANFPALVRGAVAVGWFGIQTWIGGGAMHLIFGQVFGTAWSEAAEVGGYEWTLWLSFGIFWLIQLIIIMWGMEAVRKLQVFAAPMMLVGGFGLLGWIAYQAGGLGPMLARPSELGWGPEFWVVFFPSLMGMIGFWSTLSLNISDFTRFSSSQRGQIVGQSVGLPTTMTLFALLSVMVASGTEVVYGEVLWDPVVVVSQMDNPLMLTFAVFIVLVATISTNIAANLVGPSYDLANLIPRKISFRTGAVITCVLSVLIMPWRLVDDPSFYIFVWLGTVGALLGAVGGILIADYWLLRRTRMDLVGLYTPRSRYWYDGGWNWRAMAAFTVAAFLAVGGSYEDPFPSEGLIPLLRPLADYGWAVGFITALLLHWALGRFLPDRKAAEEPRINS